MKKKLSLLLALVMMLTLVPMGAFAAGPSPNPSYSPTWEEKTKSFLLLYQFEDAEVAEEEGYIRLALEQPSSIFGSIVVDKDGKPVRDANGDISITQNGALHKLTFVGASGNTFEMDVVAAINAGYVNVVYNAERNVATISLSRTFKSYFGMSATGIVSLKNVRKIYVAGTYVDRLGVPSKNVVVGTSIWKGAVSKSLPMYPDFLPTPENFAWMVTPKLEIGRGVREYTATFAIYFDGQHDYAVRVVGADFVTLNGEGTLYKPIAGPFSDNDKNDQVVYLNGKGITGTKHYTATLRTYRDTYYGDIYVDVTRGDIIYTDKEVQISKAIFGYGVDEEEDYWVLENGQLVPLKGSFIAGNDTGIRLPESYYSKGSTAPRMYYLKDGRLQGVLGNLSYGANVPLIIGNGNTHILPNAVTGSAACCYDKRAVFGTDGKYLKMAYVTTDYAAPLGYGATTCSVIGTTTTASVVAVDYILSSSTGFSHHSWYGPVEKATTLSDIYNTRNLYDGIPALYWDAATKMVVAHPDLAPYLAQELAIMNAEWAKMDDPNAVKALLRVAQEQLARAKRIQSILAYNELDRAAYQAVVNAWEAEVAKYEKLLVISQAYRDAEVNLIAKFNALVRVVSTPDDTKMIPAFVRKFNNFSKLRDGRNIRLVAAEYVPLSYTLTLDDGIKTVVADGFTKYIVNVTLKAHGGYLPSIVDWTLKGGKTVVPSRYTGHVWEAKDLPRDFRGEDVTSDFYDTQNGFYDANGNYISASQGYSKFDVNGEAYDVFGKYAGTLQDKFSTLLDWDQRSYVDPEFYWGNKGMSKGEWWTEQRAVELRKEMKMQLLIQPNMNAEEVTLNAKGIGVGAGTAQALDLTIPVLKLDPILKMETTLTKAPAGQKLIKTADITLTEKVAGAIKSGYTYKLTLDNKYSAVFNDQDVKVEVVYADGEQKQLQISDDDVSGNVISFFVQKQSVNKPAVIKITGVAVDAAREIPFGTYKLALSMQDPRITVKTKVAEVDYLEIVNVPLGGTEKPAGKKVTIFTIGQKFYTENGEVKYMDVAPWIQNSRAMLPIAFVANALSVNYVWDPVARTATFMDGTRTVVLKAGSDSMTVNGAAEKMDGPAVIQNSRMFVSVAYVGKAFGLESGKDIVWDATAKTVTITK